MREQQLWWRAALTLRWLVVLVLAIGGVGKLTHPQPATMSVLSAIDTSYETAHRLVLSLASFELLLAATLVMPAMRRMASVGLGVLCLAFLAFAVLRESVGSDVPCGCFGGLLPASSDSAHLWVLAISLPGSAHGAVLASGGARNPTERGAVILLSALTLSFLSVHLQEREQGDLQVAERLDELILVLKSREQAIQDYTVHISESISVGGNVVAGTCTAFAQRGDQEKWVRFSARGMSLDLARPPHVLMGEVAESIRPSFYQADGTRTLWLEPDASNDRLWTGLLMPEVSTQARSGAINCCLMFGEQWLSTVLERCTAKGRREEGANTELVLQLGDQEDPSELRVLIDPEHRVHHVDWKKHSQPVFFSRVLQHEDVDGNWFPTEGYIEYSYGEKQRIDSRYSYVKRPVGPVVPSLTTLPSEIVAVDGGAIVTDMSSDASFWLGSETLRAELGTRLENRLGGSGRTGAVAQDAAERGPEQGAGGSERTVTLVIAAVAAVLGAAFFLRVISRGRPRVV